MTFWEFANIHPVVLYNFEGITMFCHVTGGKHELK